MVRLAYRRDFAAQACRPSATWFFLLFTAAPTFTLDVGAYFFCS